MNPTGARDGGLEEGKPKNTLAACDLEMRNCRPCILSRIMVVVFIGYALFQFLTR